MILDEKLLDEKYLTSLYTNEPIPLKTIISDLKEGILTWKELVTHADKIFPLQKTTKNKAYTIKNLIYWINANNFNIEELVFSDKEYYSLIRDKNFNYPSFKLNLKKFEPLCEEFTEKYYELLISDEYNYLYNMLPYLTTMYSSKVSIEFIKKYPKLFDKIDLIKILLNRDFEDITQFRDFRDYILNYFKEQSNSLVSVFGEKLNLFEINKDLSFNSKKYGNTRIFSEEELYLLKPFINHPPVIGLTVKDNEEISEFFNTRLNSIDKNIAKILKIPKLTVSIDEIDYL